MGTVGQQINVVEYFVFGAPALVADFDTAQPLDPRHPLHTRHHQTQRIAVFGAQHLAVHGPSHDYIVERVFHGDGAGHR